MAEFAKMMAKSPMVRSDTSPQCRYLFHHQFCTQQPVNANVHVHPAFWHIDVLTAGRALVVTPDGAHGFTTGQILLIPANVVHAFRYPEVGTAWFSIKFACDGIAHPDRPLTITPTELQGRLVAILREYVQPPVLSAADTSTVGYLLAALLTQVCSAEDHPPKTSPFLTQLTRWLAAHAGEALSVAEVARAFGYTPGHASARVKQECGLSLKAFLDQQRADAAERLLIFTDLGIGEIAGQLAFPDVYAFSRFFHRMKGVGPRTFRRDSQMTHTDEPEQN